MTVSLMRTEPENDYIKLFKKHDIYAVYSMEPIGINEVAWSLEVSSIVDCGEFRRLFTMTFEPCPRPLNESKASDILAEYLAEAESFKAKVKKGEDVRV